MIDDYEHVRMSRYGKCKMIKIGSEVEGHALSDMQPIEGH